MKSVSFGKVSRLGITIGILVALNYMKHLYLPDNNSQIIYQTEDTTSRIMEKPKYNHNNQLLHATRSQNRKAPPETTTTNEGEIPMCTNLERKMHISKQCQISGNAIPWRNSRYIRDDKRKLMFCEVSKSGCSTWKALWEHANNSSIALEYYAANPKMVHFYGMHMSGLRLNQKKPNDDLILNYTKFLVVRHPFERLLSAFYNIKNWKRGQPGPTSPFKRHLQREFNLTYNGSIPDLQFKQFVHYIMHHNISKKFYNDRHIAPYSHTCGICHLQYDYILRLGTIHDAQPIVKLLGYPDNFLSSRFSVHSGQTKLENQGETTSIKIFDEYHDLSSSLLKMLFDRYQNDLKLFGYHFNTTSSKAWCAIETGNGKICC